jgi:hypothetical protein
MTTPPSILKSCISEGDLYRLSRFSTDKSYQWLWTSIQKGAIPYLKTEVEYDIALFRVTITPRKEVGRFVYHSDLSTPEVLDVIIAPGNLLLVTDGRLIELSRGDAGLTASPYRIGFQADDAIVIYQFEVETEKKQIKKGV